MTSQNRTIANRRNSLHSTGSCTPEGKLRSSRNALKHGLTAKTDVIPGDPYRSYKSYRRNLLAELNPTSFLDRELADRVIGDLWRLKRIPKLESAIMKEMRDKEPSVPPALAELAIALANAKNKCRVRLDAPSSSVASTGWLEHSDHFARFVRYESSLERSLFRCLNEYRKSEARRVRPDAPSLVGGRDNSLVPANTLSSVALAKEDARKRVSPQLLVPGCRVHPDVPETSSAAESTPLSAQLSRPRHHPSNSSNPNPRSHFRRTLYQNGLGSFRKIACVKMAQWTSAPTSVSVLPDVSCRQGLTKPTPNRNIDALAGPQHCVRGAGIISSQPAREGIPNLADKYIKVQAISGFTEYLPGEQIAFNRTRELIERVYQRYGFTPLETPAVERWEILTAKSGIDRQIYSVGKPERTESEQSEQPALREASSLAREASLLAPELGLRFDLTVPLARFVAQHANDLTFPFRRYQIQPVWRGERPQQGRFRQFYQADIDIIGSGELDPVYEAEVLCVINDAFKALTFMPEVKIHISNRKILTGLCVDYGISGRAAEVLREVDKAQRDGAQAVKDAVTKLLARDMPAGFESLLSELVGGVGADIKALNKILKGRSQALAGAAELDRVHKAAVSLGVPSDRLIIDPTIARGLDYYTGTVYETIVTGFDQWGSVCSGGRYDDLASYFTTQRYPGVGVSIGLSRLVDLLMKNGMLKAERKSVADVLVTMQDRAAFLDKYLAIARSLRDAGINTEVFSDDARLMKQLGYGGRIGIPYAVVAGGDEFARNTAKVRDLTTREEKEFPLAELAAGITAMLRERQGKV